MVPHAFFQPTSLPAGSVCSVHVNVFIAPVHDMLRLSTGFSDQVVRDFVVRHELAHCGEHASRNDYLVAKLRGEAAPAGVTITDKAAALYDSVAASQFRGSNAVVEGKLRKSMLDAMEQVGSDMITLQGEEYADGFAALTLLKEGRIKVDDISQIAEFRRAFWEKDPVHDSSSLLVNLLDQLRLHPELLQGRQESHIRDQATGRSLQISDLQSWYVPFWKAHAAARDDEHQLKRGPSVTRVPEYPSLPQVLVNKLHAGGPFAAMVGGREGTPGQRKVSP